jgi:VIT1/CCC1 family predicted Fe2+/Mn2+ transporter
MRELMHNPQAETSELAGMYRSHGMSAAQATAAATEVMRDPQRAVLVHAREEFGLDPAQLPNPLSVAMVSLISFLIGALLPVIPWIVSSGDQARLASVTIGVTTAAVVGASIAKRSDRPMLFGGLRQVAILIAAVAVTYLIGSLVGVNLS